MTQLKPAGKDIWIYDGSIVSFYGFPFPTRMTIIRLTNGDLWVHSPEKMNASLKDELASLGEVKHLVSPNKLHHLFLPEWINEYPEAKTYAAPGLSKKRNDINFDIELSESPQEEWGEVISQTIFRGSPAMEEVVFYHRPSGTLILTDLIENFNPDTLNWWQTKLARYVGILYPEGKTPIDWRFTFRFGSKNRARKSLAIMLGWKPENIILSHGVCVFRGGTEFLKSSFSWLQKTTWQ